MSLVIFSFELRASQGMDLKSKNYSDLPCEGPDILTVLRIHKTAKI